MTDSPQIKWSPSLSVTLVTGDDRHEKYAQARAEGLSMGKAAARAGCSKRAAVNWENPDPQKNPRPEVLQRITWLQENVEPTPEVLPHAEALKLEIYRAAREALHAGKFRDGLSALRALLEDTQEEESQGKNRYLTSGSKSDTKVLNLDEAKQLLTGSVESVESESEDPESEECEESEPNLTPESNSDSEEPDYADILSAIPEEPA